MFSHLYDVNGWSTHRLLDQANSIIATVNALSMGETLKEHFIHDEKLLGPYGEISPSVEEALTRVLLAADVNQRRLQDSQTPPYPWDMQHADPFSQELPGVSGEPAERRGFVKLKPERVAVPDEGVAAQVDFLAFLQPDLLRLYHPDSREALRPVPPSPERVDELPITRGFDPEDYPALIQKFVACGMFGLRKQKPLVINGLFGTPKDEAKDRLIADCRRANLFFTDPPGVSLPTPADIADLIITSTATDQHVICVAKTDVNAFYHRLRLPEWMQEYFGFPQVEIDGQIWWPVSFTLPMGFSHAVPVAHNVHLNIVRPIFSEAGVIEVGVDPFLDVPPHRSALVVYIDDNSQISLESRLAKVNRLQDKMVAAMEGEGLMMSPNKLVRANFYVPETDLLGVAILRGGGIFPKAGRMAALDYDTMKLIQHPRASSRSLGSIVGRWVWTCLLARPSLAILQTVYVHIATDSSEVRNLTNEMTSELRTLMTVSPLLSANLFAPLADIVMATDASLAGAGVCVAEVPSPEYRRLYSRRIRKGWWSAARPDEPGDFNPLLDYDPDTARIVAGAEWRTVVSYKFKFEETRIVLLEAQALLTGLRWLFSDPKFFGRRIIFFLDSQSLLGAVVKGRSSSRRLNHLCRKMAAFFLTSQIKPSFLWIPSQFNPADGPSRAGGAAQ